MQVWKFNSHASSLYILIIKRKNLVYIYGSFEIWLGNCNKNTEYEEKDTVRSWMVRLIFSAGQESVVIETDSPRTTKHSFVASSLCDLMYNIYVCISV